jgi:hypothetical protein
MEQIKANLGRLGSFTERAEVNYMFDKPCNYWNPIKVHGRNIKQYVLYAERHNYKKTTKIYKTLGCTQQELLQHLEKQFLAGMNWENRHLWHIDHIIPMDSAKAIEDNYKLNHFTNLRPMWAKDNLSKKNNITHLI